MEHREEERGDFGAPPFDESCELKRAKFSFSSLEKEPKATFDLGPGVDTLDNQFAQVRQSDRSNEDGIGEEV